MRFPVYFHTGVWNTNAEKEFWSRYDDHLSHFYTAGTNTNHVIQLLCDTFREHIELLFSPDPVTGDTPLIAVRF